MILGPITRLLVHITRSSNSLIVADRKHTVGIEQFGEAENTHTHTVDYHPQLLSTIVSRVSFPFGLRQATNESVVDTSRLPGKGRLTSPAQGSPAVIEWARRRSWGYLFTHVHYVGGRFLTLELDNVSIDWPHQSTGKHDGDEASSETIHQYRIISATTLLPDFPTTRPWLKA